MLQSEAGNDLALMELLDKYGPVSIGMDCSSPLFGSYKSGIFASPKSPSSPMCNAANIGKLQVKLILHLNNFNSFYF